MLPNFFKQNRKFFFWLVICLGLLSGGWQIVSNTLKAVVPQNAPLVINEFVAINKTGATDEDGGFSDWIEIHNRSNFPVNMAGWSLTDDAAQPEKWPFPDIVLAPDQYLVVFASGKDRKLANTQLHTNFRLKNTGEFLGLYNVFDQRFTDAIRPQYPYQFGDISYGLDSGGRDYNFFASPTPGELNLSSLSWAGAVSDIEFSEVRGFYETPFQLELAAAHPDTTIRYTKDGAAPTETSGLVYTAPFTIDTTTVVRAAGFRLDHLPSSVNTHTYLFLDDVLTQPANPAGFPDTWGTHQKTIWEYVAGTPVMSDYGMDSRVVNDLLYRDTLNDDLKSIPSLSLVTDVENLAEIYANPQERGRVWERPVSAEFILPEGEREGFQVDAGVRIQGGVNRFEYVPKHAFRLFFRGEYGSGRLEYPLFPDSAAQSFDTLVLRAGTNDSYTGQLKAEKSGFEIVTYTRDEWLRESQIELSGVGSHGIFVHLYLNGLYWGLYNVVERPDADFAATYLGGDKVDWYAINHNGPINNTIDDFDALKTELYNLNNLDYDDRYLALKQYIDIDAFIDYIILNWYAGTKDWPDNNWYAGMKLPDEKIRFFVWDGEITWRHGGAKLSLGEEANIVKEFFDSLIQYPDFRQAFADRLYKHLYNDGALTDANSQRRWLNINQQIDRAIVGESARWGDVRREEPFTREDWLNSVEDVLAIMEGNADRLILLMREQGYYPPVDPPLFNQHGGLVTPGFELEMVSAPGSVIYYTTDGTDPRTSLTGAAVPTVRRYTVPVVITDTTQVKARVLLDDSLPPEEQVWSALAEATFNVVAERPELHITEIMYNPLVGNDYEFIELQNTADTAFNLAMMYFEGIDYTFPTNTTLAPGESIVLVRNPQAFAERYPEAIIGGVYAGSLSNKGEALTLKNVRGEIVAAVAYDDENGWPLSPDGRGDSLIIIDTNRDPNDPANWRASSDLYGSPGQN